MNNKLVIGGVITALVLSVLAITNKPTETVVERVVEKQLGAMPGDTLDSKSFTVNGVKTHYYSSGLSNSSSTSLTANSVCSFKVVATSTLVAANMKINTNEAWEQVYEIGIGANAYATTTRLGIKSIAASVPGEIVASTTDSVTGFSGNVLIPGRYINFKYASGSPSTAFNPTGRCEVVYREL